MPNAADDRALLSRVREILPTITGWCSYEKAARLVDTIVSENPSGLYPRDGRPLVLVEIGVFGGSSFFPQALALQAIGRGVIYGIDPWRRDAALEAMAEEANVKWWGSVDLEAVYAGCREKIRELELERFCRLIRARSEDVVDFFEPGQIDLLHVDGNHSEEKSLADVLAYLPRVRRGGAVFFDDMSWHEKGRATTARAADHLREHCLELGTVGDCAIFAKA